MTSPAPGIELRDLIRQEIRKQLLEVDQVALATVSSIVGRGQTFLELNGGGWAESPKVANFTTLAGGDIEIIVRVEPWFWSEGAGVSQAFLQIRDPDGDQHWIAIHLTTGGRPQFIYSDGTQNPHVIANADPPFITEDFTVKSLKFQFTADAGGGDAKVRFWWSDDESVWTEIGTEVTVTGGATSTLFSGSTGAALQIGRRVDGFYLQGKIFSVQVNDGIDGPLVSRTVFTPESGWRFGMGIDSTVEDESGIPLTLKGNAQINAEVAEVLLLLDGMNVPVPATWASTEKPVVGDRVVANGLRGGDKWAVVGRVDGNPFLTKQQFIQGQLFVEHHLQHINMRETDDPEYPFWTAIVDVNGRRIRLFWVDQTGIDTQFVEGLLIDELGTVSAPNQLNAGYFLALARDGTDEGGEIAFQGAGAWTDIMYIDRFQDQMRMVLDGQVIGKFSAESKWNPWTPTLTATTTNPNLGSTGTAVGRYIILPTGFCVARFEITFGGTGISAGSGPWWLSYPVAPANHASDDQIGLLRAQVAPNPGWGTIEWESATQAQPIFYVSTAAGTPISAAGLSNSNCAPVAGNFLNGMMIYEVAA